MAAVSLRGVVKSLGAVRVIQDVDLEIGNGEFVVLVGRSGCGKSTLLRMIAGLETIRGEVLIGGEIVNDMSPKERNIAMVFQSYALYPHMTVRENLGFSLKLSRAPRAEAAAKSAPPTFWASATCSSESPVSYLAANASASRLAGRLCAIRRCFCSTSRFPIWTRRSVCRCGSSSPNSTIGSRRR